MDTFISGCSSAASSDAEYIDAPASFTMIYCVFTPISLINSDINFSDSLEAVPFPIAITSILYFSINFFKLFLACSSLL